MNQPLSPNVELTFHIMREGKPVAKKVIIKRETFLAYNAHRYEKFADMYADIVKDKAYISIEDTNPTVN